MSGYAERLGVTPQAVFYACKRNKLTRKKTTLYQEQNEEKRTEYKQDLKRVDPASIVYVDETGFDSVLYRRYARAKRGVKVMANISGKRYVRTSMIAGLQNNSMVAPLVFKGYCDAAVVLIPLQS